MVLQIVFLIYSGERKQIQTKKEKLEMELSEVTQQYNIGKFSFCFFFLKKKQQLIPYFIIRSGNACEHAREPQAV